MALALQQVKVISNGTGSAATPAFTPTAAVGQVMLVAIFYDGGANATTTLTDNATTPNTYTLIPGASGGNLTNGYIACYWAKITTAKATPIVTLTFNSAATNANVAAAYIDGFTTTPTLDQLKIQLNTTSTTVTSGASGTTGSAVQIVIGIGGWTGAVTTPTAGTGYSGLVASNVAAGSIAVEALVTASAGAQTTTMTLAATRVNTGIVITINDGAVTTTNNGAGFLLALGAF